MRNEEYRKLQRDLTRKIEKGYNPHKCSKYENAYKEGLLAAKSILKQHQTYYFKEVK